MRFEKWQALGNDYIVVEAAALPWELTAERIRRICEPHFGVGSDGILLLSRGRRRSATSPSCGSSTPTARRPSSRATAPARRSSTCGAAGWTDADTFTILTKAGEVTPTITGPGEVSMAIGRASVTSTDYPAGPADGTGTVESAGASGASSTSTSATPSA